MIARTKQRGFSLIEIIIAIMIFLIIIYISAAVFIQEYQIFNVSQSFISADWQGNLALARMTSDLRSATKISSADSNTLTFQDSAGNNVTYYLSGNQLIYSTATSSAVLADNIQNLTFGYYDSSKNGTPTSDTSKIRYVVITCNVVDSNVNFELSTATYLANYVL